jgi:hypothetical protein
LEISFQGGDSVHQESGVGETLDEEINNIIGWLNAEIEIVSATRVVVGSYAIRYAVQAEQTIDHICTHVHPSYLGCALEINFQGGESLRESGREAVGQESRITVEVLGDPKHIVQEVEIA